jgi:hypothetical protein
MGWSQSLCTYQSSDWSYDVWRQFLPNTTCSKWDETLHNNFNVQSVCILRFLVAFNWPIILDMNKLVNLITLRIQAAISTTWSREGRCTSRRKPSCEWVMLYASCWTIYLQKHEHPPWAFVSFGRQFQPLATLQHRRGLYSLSLICMRSECFNNHVRGLTSDHRFELDQVTVDAILW